MNWRHFVCDYVDLIKDVPLVQAVWVDSTSGLDVCTVYRGDLDEIDSAIYGVYREMYRLYPTATPDFRLISADRRSHAHLPQKAIRVFVRGGHEPA